MAKVIKTLHLDKEQVEEIERLREDDPVYQQRGFSEVARLLLDKALAIVGREREEKEEK